MLAVISLILIGVVVFNVIFRNTDLLVAAALAGIGFILGFYIFSRMSAVEWNEQEKIVQSGRMDIVGYIALGLYIVFEISFRTFLHDFSAVSVTAFLLAGIGGTLLGRVVGTVVEIHTVFRASRPI